MDQGLKTRLCSLLMAYNPEWLRLGLEMVLGDSITISQKPPAAAAVSKAAPARLAATRVAHLPARSLPPASRRGAGGGAAAGGAGSASSAERPAAATTTAAAAVPGGLAERLRRRAASLMPLQRRPRLDAARAAAATTAAVAPAPAPTTTAAVAPPAAAAKSAAEMTEGVLRRVIVTRLLADRRVTARYARSRRGVFDKEHGAEQARLMLGRVLALILFLDAARGADILDGRCPCLFVPAAGIKSSREVLVAFCKEVLRGEGDPLRHLINLGYSVTHTQTRLEEAEWGVTSLAVDLRDGLRLARVTELLARAAPMSLCKVRCYCWGWVGKRGYPQRRTYTITPPPTPIAEPTPAGAVAHQQGGQRDRSVCIHDVAAEPAV